MNMLKKTLLATAMLAASASAFASCGSTSYTVTTTSITLYTKLGPNIFPVDGAEQRFLLDHTDCTFSSTIYNASGDPVADALFTLTGTWASPVGSTYWYLALDGDVSQGMSVDPDTSWGRLFYSSDFNLNNFMNIIYGDDVFIRPGSFSVVTNASKTNRAYIVPNKTLDGGKTFFEVGGVASTVIPVLGKPDKAITKPWTLRSFGLTSTITAGI